MKSLLIAAAAVAVLALGALAIGGAASTAQEADGPFGTFLSKVADKLGIGEDELQTAIDEARDETLDEAVDEGLLTEEQAERLQDRQFPFRGFGAHMRHGHGDVMAAAAEVLDIPMDELMEQLKDGNTLAELADGQGMSAEDFEAALLDQVQTRLGELVAEGDLTQEQADEIFQRTEDNIDGIVNSEGCTGGLGKMRHGMGGFGGPGFHPFFDGDDEAESTETSEVTA